jgi:ubiquinone/menaquinone biosynthesis C-methylase UbiE
MKYLKVKDFFNKIAKFYDIMMNEVDYKEWAFYIEEIIKKFSRGNKILDLACGTGNIIEFLKNKNYEIFGLDLSFNMLKLAKRKDIKNLVNGTFFKLPFKDNSFDVVLSTFDSLNNVENLDDLKVVFNEVYRVLKNGGLWTFDLNTIFVFINYWNNYFKIDDLKDLIVIWKSKFIIPNSCLLKIYIFEKIDEDIYKKYDGELLEFSFGLEDVKNALKEVNFKEIKIYEHLSFRKGHEKNYRVQFVAIK